MKRMKRLLPLQTHPPRPISLNDATNAAMPNMSTVVMSSQGSPPPTNKQTHAHIGTVHSRALSAMMPSSPTAMLPRATGFLEQSLSPAHKIPRSVQSLLLNLSAVPSRIVPLFQIVSPLSVQPSQPFQSTLHSPPCSFTPQPQTHPQDLSSPCLSSQRPHNS